MEWRYETRTINALVGQFFHSYKGDEVEWQGSVLGRVEEGVYLVQLYEWLTGSPSNRHLVTIQEMKGWKFYPDTKSMNAAYANYSDRRSKKASL